MNDRPAALSRVNHGQRHLHIMIGHDVGHDLREHIRMSLLPEKKAAPSARSRPRAAKLASAAETRT